MIKVVTPKKLFVSAFLVCSFYYIMSIIDGNHGRPLFDANLEADFKIEREKYLPISSQTFLQGLSSTIVPINESVHPQNTDQGEVFENNGSTDYPKWTEFLKSSLKQVLDLINHSDVVTQEEYEMMKREAISKERLLLQEDLKNYSTMGYFRHRQILLSIENGGTPVRNIIFTTWRSGSTFLGEVVTSHPGTFYHYEPLLHFEIVQVRSGDLANEGIRVLKSLLQCDYSNLDEYVKYGKDHLWLHFHNWRFWKHCKKYDPLCVDPTFLEEMCKLYPFQIMKTVRIRLRLAEELLRDESLNSRILFLVRDPRGTLQSRKHRDWCPPSPDCSDPKRLCSDMVEDYNAAVEILKKYPDKIMIIRYEDLSMNPFSGVKKVLEFFRLKFHPMVENFLKTHTGKNEGGVSSTFRDSKTTPFRWLNYFKNKQEELVQIEEDCSEAMNLWGYDLFKTYWLNNSKSFKPMLKPPWNHMIIPNDSIL